MIENIAHLAQQKKIHQILKLKNTDSEIENSLAELK